MQKGMVFYDEEYRKTLSYLGTVSGREEKKIEKAGLHTAFVHDAPYFTEANTVLVCRKLYAQEMQEDCFLDAALIEKNYPQKDYHTMYVAEIEHVYQK